MDGQGRLGKIVCIFRGYTVMEVFEDAEQTQLAGFRLFGHRLPNDVVYPTP